MAALNASVVAVPASTSATTIMAANPGVRQRIVENASTATLYLRYGAGAAANARTVALGPGDVYELPAVAATPNEVLRGPYDGLVSGAWSAANGNAMVTEVS